MRLKMLYPAGGKMRCQGALLVLRLAIALGAIGAAVAIGAGIASAATPSQHSDFGDGSGPLHSVPTTKVAALQDSASEGSTASSPADHSTTTAVSSRPLAPMRLSTRKLGASANAHPALNALFPSQPADKPRVKQPTITQPSTTPQPVRDAPTVATGAYRPLASVEPGAKTATASRSLPRSLSAAAIVNPAVSATSAAATKPAATVAAPVAAPLNLVNVLGTLVYDVLSAAVGLFAPAPVVPPGVPVTSGRSTLAIPCGCGLAVPADWYFPDEAQPAVGLIYLQHGFFRSGANVSALAVQLAARTDSIVVAPTISSNPFTSTGYWINGTAMQQAVATLFSGSRSELNASAVAATGHPVQLPTPFVLAGHSAGGNLVTGAAGFLTHNGAITDLRAVVLFDPVDYNGDMHTALAALTGTNNVAVLTVSSPPCLCNNFDSGTTALIDARPDQFVGVRLAGGTHIDSEGASTDLPAELVCGFPLPQNVAAVQTLVSGWITDALTGTHTGIYGTPGTVLDVDGARADVLA